MEENEEVKEMIYSEDGSCPYCGNGKVRSPYGYSDLTTDVIVTCGFCENDFKVKVNIKEEK